MCLDVLRAIQREPETLITLFKAFAEVTEADAVLQQELQALSGLFKNLAADELQFMARTLVGRLVILAQAILLRQYAPDFVADAFVASRYSAFHGRVVGMLNTPQIDIIRLLQRSFAA